MANSVQEIVLGVFKSKSTPLTKDELVNLVHAQNGISAPAIMAATLKLEKLGAVQRRWMPAVKTNVYWQRSEPAHLKRRASVVPSLAAGFKTPKSAKILRKPFSTPRSREHASGTATTTPVVSVEDQVIALRSEVQLLQAEADQLAILYDTNELDTHVDNLHNYNEMKDLAQDLLGDLAGKRGVTVQVMHQEYDIDWD